MLGVFTGLKAPNKNSGSGLPPPTIPPLDLKVLQEGHSIAASGSPLSYTKQWAAANPSVPYVNTAVSGSTLDTPGRAGADNYAFFRQSADLAETPSILCLDIGTNDWDPDLVVPRYTAAAFVARVQDFVTPFRSAGGKFVASDILPCNGRGAGWDTFRDGVRTLFTAALGTWVDAYVDWHDQPVGQNGAAANAALFPDGTHPSATGHSQMLIGFNAAMNYVRSITNNPVGMSFDPVTDADPSTNYEDSYTVVGLHYGESRPYSVTSGAYVKKNAGSFVLDGTGTVVNGDVLTIRNTSSGSDSTQTDVTLTVGTTSATLSVVTAGVGGGPWDPSQLGSKLELWLKPEDLVGTDENEVASWPDSSGNSVVVASHFGAGFRPTYEATGLNGFACAESDADTDYFDLPSGFVASRTASSTFFVAKKNGSAGGGDQCPVRKWGQSEDYYPHPSGSFYLSYMASAYFGPLSGPDVSSAWHFGSFHATAGDWRWYHNGTLQSSQSTFTFAPQTGSPILLKEFHGYLSEVIDCDNTLTTLERQKVEGYLAWKYGMEADLPSGHPYESAAPTT
jgi:lysophospholipase L1-like esterase